MQKKYCVPELPTCPGSAGPHEMKSNISLELWIQMHSGDLRTEIPLKAANRLLMATRKTRLFATIPAQPRAEQ